MNTNIAVRQLSLFATIFLALCSSSLEAASQMEVTLQVKIEVNDKLVKRLSPEHYNEVREQGRKQRESQPTRANLLVLAPLLAKVLHKSKQICRDERRIMVNCSHKSSKSITLSFYLVTEFTFLSGGMEL